MNSEPPRFKRVYHHAHQKGMVTFLHSCGHIAGLLPHLIESELDVIQMYQQENIGMDRLSERFGGKIAFWYPVDIQSTMVRGSVDDVCRYARALIDRLGKLNRLPAFFCPARYNIMRYRNLLSKMPDSSDETLKIRNLLLTVIPELNNLEEQGVHLRRTDLFL